MNEQESPSTDAPNTREGLEDNIYTRLLGVRPHLGAHEHVSRLGGGRMSRDVMAAMLEANDYFVDMNELNVAAGRRAAELLGAEAALVTAGAFSAMMLGAAACLTGTDAEKVAQLPHPAFERRECLIQTCQRLDYDRAYRLAGATVVYGDTYADLEARLLEGRTALVAILSTIDRQGRFGPPQRADRITPVSPDLVPHDEMISLAHRYGVPVLVDVGSDLPPWGNIDRFLNAGSDLVVISGGKVVGGPQATGLLVGRRDLVEAARLNAYPNTQLGRGMKVGKEQVVGLIVALEMLMEEGRRESLVENWNAMARRMVDRLQGIPGLTAEYALNVSGYADAYLSWSTDRIPLDREAVQRALLDGSPRIQTDFGPVATPDPHPSPFEGLRAGSLPTEGEGVPRSELRLTVRSRVLREGEELLVADRLREIFLGAAGAGT
jgi:L-seryl-tRNA(Ser) seleniumtransferase